MEGNWGILVLLAVAVVVYALARAYGQRDEDGDTDAPESAGADGPEPGATDEGASEPDGAADGNDAAEEANMPWDECQLQLSEAPPIAECDGVEFSSPGEAETGTGAEAEREAEVEPVPESGHAANMAIRRKAGQLFRENYRKILPLSGIVVLLMAAGLMLQNTAFPAWLSAFISPRDLLNTLLAPVVTLGAAYAAARLWNGETPRPGMLFSLLKPRRILPALGLMLLKALFMALASFALGAVILLIQKAFFSTPPDNMIETMQLVNNLIYVSLLLYLYAVMWLTAWLLVAGFAFVRAPERGAMAAFRAGFRAGNRHLGSALGMLIATGWPFGVIFIIQYIGAVWSAALQSMLPSLAVESLYFLLMLFYGGYLLLSMAGLAERLLPEGGGVPRTEAESPGGDGPREDAPPEGGGAPRTEAESPGGDGLREDLLPEERDPDPKVGDAEAPPAWNAPEDGTG